VAAIFETRLREALPGRAERIMHLVRETRRGELTDGRFGRRFRGEGPYAETIAGVFRLACARAGLNVARPADQARPCDTFRRPAGAQGSLFPT
jgi:DNA repair photolyase